MRGNCPYTETTFSVELHNYKVPTQGIDKLYVKFVGCHSASYTDSNGVKHTMPCSMGSVNGSTAQEYIDVSKYDYLIFNAVNNFNANTEKVLSVYINKVD